MDFSIKAYATSYYTMQLTMGLAIVIVGAETAMCFSMLLVVARVGHSSWSDFFSPLLHVAGQYVEWFQ
jgi:hypothetical protein